MNRDIYSQAEQLNKKHRRKRTWYKILSVPICLVVFVTTYALILPAITMESTPDTYCGKVEPQGLVCTVEEHKHTEACFMNPEGEASSGETGGTGTHLYALGGFLLLLSAGALFLYQRIRRRKEVGTPN